MAKFDINIKNVTSYVNKLNNDINDYKESYLDLVRNLNKVDTAWIDNNTNFFIDNVKRDKEIITSHLQIMKKYSDNISYFLNFLESTIKSVLNVGSVSKIRFDSNKIYSIINHVNNIAEHINNCITIYNYMSIPLKFKYRNKVYEVVCNLETARNRIIRLNSDLIKLNNKIIQALNDSIVKNNKTDFIVVDSRVCKYNWKVFTPTKLKRIDNKNVNVYKINSIFNRNIKLSSTPNIVLADISQLKKNNVQSILRDGELKNDVVVNKSTSVINKTKLEDVDYDYVNNVQKIKENSFDSSLGGTKLYNDTVVNESASVINKTNLEDVDYDYVNNVQNLKNNSFDSKLEGTKIYNDNVINENTRVVNKTNLEDVDQNVDADYLV